MSAQNYGMHHSLICTGSHSFLFSLCCWLMPPRLTRHKQSAIKRHQFSALLAWPKCGFANVYFPIQRAVYASVHVCVVSVCYSLFLSTSLTRKQTKKKTLKSWFTYCVCLRLSLSLSLSELVCAPSFCMPHSRQRHFLTWPMKCLYSVRKSETFTMKQLEGEAASQSSSVIL